MRPDLYGTKKRPAQAGSLREGNMRNCKQLARWLALLLAFGLLAAACSGDGGEDSLGDGSLGMVTVEEGDAIQIRSLEAITGDPSAFGLPIDRATHLAVEDYGQIHGFDVDLGTSLDDLCSNDGGQASAQAIVADEDVVGVIGTSCSGAAVAAAPLITDAGMVLISGGNTSPALTSDLAGTAGPNYSVGYYRTAHNDLYQGAAVAKFVFSELGITEAAAIHDGDPYTQGLAQAFRDAFEREGGTMTGFSAVNKGDSDMVPVLTEIAAQSPGALFFPIFQPEGDFIAEQAPGVPGLEGTVLLAADGLLVDRYLALPQTAGHALLGPGRAFRRQHQPEHGQNCGGDPRRLRGGLRRVALGVLLGARIRRDHAAARCHQGGRLGRGRHPDDRPPGHPRPSEQRQRLQRRHRHHQL